MAEVEAILNSRPLKNNEDQPHNEELLTPNQFLIQRPFSSLPPENFADQQQGYFQELEARSAVDESHLARLAKGLPADSNQETEKKTDSNQLPLKIGDIVWVLQDLTSRGIWPTGRVVDTTPGKYGKVRVVKVKMA